MFIADSLASTSGLISQKETCYHFSVSPLYTSVKTAHTSHALWTCVFHTQLSNTLHLKEFSQFLNGCVLRNRFSSSQNPCHELWQHTRYHRLLTLTSYWACAPLGLLVGHSASAFWKTCAWDSGDPQNRCNRETQSLCLPLETLTSPLPYIYFCFCQCSNYV